MDDRLSSSLSLDAALDRLQRRIAGLNRKQATVLFAVCGNALLPFYEKFVAKSGWGDISILRRAAAFAAGYAVGEVSEKEDSKLLLNEIATVVPDGERFDAPGSTFAQDAAICLDAAVRTTNPNESFNPAWIEYVLEPATQIAAEEQTGYLDLGTTDEGKRWRQQALTHPGLFRAYQTIWQLIDIVEVRQTFRRDELAEMETMVGKSLMPETRQE